MTTYFIDGEAAVNGDGSFESPYNTTPTISSDNVYLYAANRVLNGQTATAIYIPANATNVEIGAYDLETGVRLVSGSQKALIYSETRWPVRVGTNAHSFLVEMLDISGGGSNTSLVAGLYIGNSSALVANDGVVRNCRIHDIIGDNASSATGLSFRGSNFSCYDNEIFNIYTDGIYGVGNNPKIYRNKIYKIDQAPSYGFGDCIQINGDATLGCSNVHIYDNVLENPKTNKQCIIVQDTTRASTGGFIEDNFCKMPKDTGISNVIFTEITGITIRRNYIWGGSYGVFVGADNTTVNSNLIFENETGIAQESSVASGIRVYNNTISGSSNKGINTTDDTTALIYNNLVFQCNIGISKHGSATEDYNAYWRCTTDQANTGGTPSWGSNNITIDPVLTPSKLLKSTSPLLKAGVYIGTYLDALGAVYNNPPTIGAYEYVSSRGTR